MVHSAKFGMKMFRDHSKLSLLAIIVAL